MGKRGAASSFEAVWRNWSPALSLGPGCHLLSTLSAAFPCVWVSVSVQLSLLQGLQPCWIRVRLKDFILTNYFCNDPNSERIHLLKEL